MIYIDTDDQARHTNVGASLESNKATWAAFRSYRHLDVGKDRARFLLDYHNAAGDLAGTICLDAAAFTAITGEIPKGDASYRRIDEHYWEKARSAREAA